MRRRTILQLGVTGAASGLAGCWARLTDHAAQSAARGAEDTSPQPHPVIDADDDRPVINLVEEGADPAGQNSLLPFLDEFAADDTILYLPEGRYAVPDTWFAQAFTNFALVGDDATLIPAENHEDSLILVADARHIQIAGLTFSFDAPERNGRALNLHVVDDLTVADVTIDGIHRDGNGPIRIDITDPDGKGVVRDVTMLDGGEAGSRITGIYVGNRNRGNIDFIDCQVGNFPDNGLYADPPEGNISVTGGQYVNNGIANIRLKGGSLVRDARIRCDDSHRQFENMRGIRLTDYTPRSESEPAVVENCRVELLDLTHSDGAIELSTQLASLLVRDTTVRVDVDDVDGIRAKTPDPVVANGATEPRIECENVTIIGSAANGAAIRVTERHGCRIERSYIYQTGRQRDGIEFRRSTDNILRNNAIDVGGTPIELVDATASIDRTFSRPTIRTGIF